jgi:hypothetical protein
VRIYSALASDDYEYQDLLGIFKTKEEAVECCHKQRHFGKYLSPVYGVVESELGQMIDLDVMIEWID